VDGHASRLVDDDDVGIFVENVEGDGFWLSAKRRARLCVNGDAFAAAEFLRGFGRASVDEDEAGFDQLLDACAAEVGELRGKIAVETLARFVSGDDKLMGDCGSHGRILAVCLSGEIRAGKKWRVGACYLH
jgi:hypothetical protein